MHRLAALMSVVVSLPSLGEEAPVSLTASDGAGLTLVSYTARAVVEDPLAFTELTLVFENPRDRVIEGQFRVTLPVGATVSRFAMKAGEKWQEGEVVEKQAARRAYEDFLHRRQDPALLEQAAGNEFSARVFPIPARGRKELIVSWSHELTSSSAPFVLPLKGLPQVASLDVEVFSGGSSLARLEKQRFVPDKDLSVLPPRAGRTGLRSRELVVTRVKAVASSQREALPSLLLLVDTSASRALGFSAQLTQLGKLVERLAAASSQTDLTVAAFDQSVQVVFEGPVGRFGPEDVKRLRDRRALGASDLSRALGWALEQGKKKSIARVVLLTDGVFTAGAIDGVELLAAVARLKDAGVQRLDVVVVGGIRDEGLLKRLVAAKLPKVGTVLDGELDAGRIVQRLMETTVAKVPIVAQGAKLVWPSQLEGVQAGDEAVVFLELPDASAKAVLTVGGTPVDLSTGLGSVERPLLERAWARARIEALLVEEGRAADGKDARKKLREEIVAISEKHRVLSPYTALLVLETEADYARFHIDRRALSDLITVQNGHLGVLHRAYDAVATIASPKKAEVSRSETAEKKKDARAPAPTRDEVESSLEPPSAEEAQREVAKEGAASPPPGAATPPAAPSPSLAEPVVVDRASESERKAEAAPGAEPIAERPAPAPPPPPSSRSLPAAPSDVVPSGGAAVQEARRRRPSSAPAPASAESLPQSVYPYEGNFKDVMMRLGRGEREKGLERALAWREESPGDVLALVALGEACEAGKDVDRAARAYGSIIDLFPARADLRRFAGGRLERLTAPAALELATDSFAKAVEERPDHPASHRMLAFALLRAGKPAKAFEAIEKGVRTHYPEGRFAGVEQILREDAGLIAAAWMKAEPHEAETIKARLARLGGTLEDAPSLRFVLTWETDANDVDFHILDGRGGHAFYGARELPSGGSLYADVTTGYGPECFTIRLPPQKRAYPYVLKAHYYSRGPMGYGMGKLELIEHDGKGGLRFEERPYVVMVDQAFVDLGTVKR